MKIISVKINDILSIQDAYVEFDDNGLMLVQGWNHDVGRANGAGKTAIFNAIAFAVFDKLPRKVTATEIVRRGCKSGSVEVTVETAGDRYMVRRCRPKGVTFYKVEDNQQHTQLAITQEGWEQILKLNYNQFVISMYCAQGTSERFLSTNDSGKKQFLLQLLNLEEFSSCKMISDKRSKLLEDELTALRSKLDSIESKIDAYSESLVDENVYNYHIKLSNDVIKSLTSELIQVQTVPRPDLSKYQKLEEDISSKKIEFARTRVRREMLHDTYRKTAAKIKPYSAQAQCETCGSTLDTSSAETHYNEEARRIQDGLVDIKNQIDACDTILTKESQVTELQAKLRDKKRVESKDYENSAVRSSDIQTKIALKQKEVEELNLKLKNNLELERKIKDLSDVSDNLSIKRANILRDIDLYKTISAMYSPTGAQAYILDSVIESFNERVSEYVSFLWSNMTYALKSYKENVKGDVTAKFSEHLIMNGADVSIGSLSGGEFRALSLCVDFALVDVMERQFGIHLSPIVLDEPFDGLDAAGREYIVELLEKMATDRQVVVVDHTSEVKSMFSKVINIEKRNDISSISSVS